MADEVIKRGYFCGSPIPKNLTGLKFYIGQALATAREEGRIKGLREAMELITIIGRGRDYLEAIQQRIGEGEK